VRQGVLRTGTGLNAVLGTAVLHASDSLQNLSSEWRELVASSPTATPFQTFEWQQIWLRHYAAKSRLHLITVREGKDLVGLMPLFQSQGVWKSLRAIGSGASDYLHAIARAGYEEKVGRAVSESLSSTRGADLIDLHQIREDMPLSPLPPNYLAIEQARCLVLSLPSTYEAYLAMLSKSLRYDVRRLDKDLFKTGRASVQGVAPEGIDEGMNLLFETHRKRWRKRGLPGAFLGRSEAFHREWAHVAAAQGWLWLSLLKVDGETIGAIYAMTLGDACYYYQAGFDPMKGSISPGTLLVAHTIRRAIEEGKGTFDFLRGDEPYKMRWKAQRTLTNNRYLRAVSPMPGQMGLRWNRAGSVVESRLRARLEGRGLL
jgi:CelD/BcsL family acetyltransferase involved in cellulose biosynthesis